MKTRFLIFLVLCLVFLASAGEKALAFSVFGHEMHIIGTKAWREAREQKLQENITEPMVQTVDEWHQRATSVNMEHRETEPYKPEVDPKMVEKWDIPTYFDAYNSNPGSREFSIELVKRDKSARSIGVISPDFELMAYTEAYYYPSNQEVISSFFIYELDTTKSKKQRVTDASVFGGSKKTPLISSTNEYIKQYLFSLFTIIDWSKDSRRVLLKEKVGSTIDGIFTTNLWVYFLEDNGIPASAKRFDKLNTAITQYWFDKEKLILNRYRWGIKPLGFYAANEDIVLVSAHTYDDKMKELVFLGLWGINIYTEEIKFVVSEPTDTLPVSSNGFVLEKRLP